MKSLNNKIEIKKILLNVKKQDYTKLIQFADKYHSSDSMRDYYLIAGIRCNTEIKKIEEEIEILKKEESQQWKYCPSKTYKTFIEYRDNSQ